MSNHSVANVEDVISILEENHAHLIKILRGTDLSEKDLKIYEYNVPHTAIQPRRLRMAIAAVEAALKEAKPFAK